MEKVYKFFSSVECFVNKIGLNVTLFYCCLSSFVDSAYTYTGTATCLLILLCKSLSIMLHIKIIHCT